MVCAKAINTLVFVLLARTLPKSDFGLLTYVLNTSASLPIFFFTPLSILGLRHNAIMPTTRLTVGDLSREIVVLEVIVAFVLFATPLFLSTTIFNLDVGLGARIFLFIGICLNGIVCVHVALQQAFQNGVRAADLQIRSSVVLLLASFAITTLELSSPTTLLLLFTYSPLVATLPGLNIRATGARLTGVLKRYVPMMITSLINFPISLIVLGLVAKQGGMDSVAGYSLLLQLTNLIGFVATAIYPYLLSRYSVRQGTESLGLLWRDISSLVFLSVGCVGAYIMIAPLVIETLLPNYGDISHLGLVFIGSGLLVLLKVPVIAHAQADNLFWIDTVIGISGGILYILSIFILDSYGLWGVSWARLISCGFETLMAISLILLIRRRRNQLV